MKDVTAILETVAAHHGITRAEVEQEIAAPSARLCTIPILGFASVGIHSGQTAPSLRLPSLSPSWQC